MSKIPPLLEIHLLGMPQIALNGHSVDGLRRKNRALIYYLAAQDRPLPREKLLSLFWPDHDRFSALPILRTMIHDLRKYLGEYFLADDKIIALSPGTYIDLHDFSTALKSSSSNLNTLADALNLYRGDFLEDFSLSDSPQFDDWVNSERERYQLLAMNGFVRLGHIHERQGNFVIALESIRRALSFNPFQEDIHRDVMRLLYLIGDRVGVIRHYESLRKLLDEEMGVPPMSETRDLYDSIIKDTFVSQPVEPKDQFYPVNRSIDKPFLPFIGREDELNLLKGELGSGKLILLEGEPGIGKTRLLTELVTTQSQMNKPVCVLQGVSYELEQGFPYHPIVAAVRKLLAQNDRKSLFEQLNLDAIWLGELSRLLPELLTEFPYIPSPTGPADELRLWEALLRLFQRLSSLWQVWLVLDDLHWADAATIAWLGYLLRNISSSTLNIVCASRPLEGQSNLTKLLQALKRDDRLVHFQLSALPESTIQKMASVLSHRHHEELSNWLNKNTEGNPFFIIELIRYAYGIGLLKKDGTLDEELFHLSPIIPVTIQNLIESRLLKLSEKARGILHVSAIIGREFDFELVRQVASFSETDTLDAIDELEAAHLISPSPQSCFTFDHYLTMQVSLNDMDETRLLSIHRRVAETLESIYQTNLDPVSGLIAHHFLSANLPEKAKTYAFRAGRFAANLAAWMDAIAFYKQALALEMVNVERAQIYVAMGVAHYHNSDFVSASNDYQSAIELAQASHDWSLLEDAHLGLSLSLYPQARFSEAIAIAKELRESGPPELAICAEFIWGASLNVESAYPLEAEQHLHNAEQLLREQRGTFVSKVSPTEIKYTLAGTFGQQGRSLDAIEQYREVLDILERGEGALDSLRNIMLYNNLAYHLHLLGDASAMVYIEMGIKLARERASLSHLPYLYSTSGEISLAKGDLDAAEKYFNDGLALAEHIPIPERVAGMTANLGLVAKQRGNIELARKRLQTALKLVEPLGNRHLEVRIRIWLAPLLPMNDARACLNSARILSKQGGLQGLFEEIVKLENKLS